MSEEDSNANFNKKKAPLTEAELTAARLQMIREFVATPRPKPAFASKDAIREVLHEEADARVSPGPAPETHHDTPFQAPEPEEPEPLPVQSQELPAAPEPPQALAAEDTSPEPASDKNKAARPEPTEPAPEPGETSNLPDPVALGQAMFNLMEKSQPLIRDFLERMKLNPPTAPEIPPQMANLAAPWLQMSQQIWQNPQKLMTAQMGLWQDYMRLWQNTTRRFMGQTYETVVETPSNDKRFADEAWSRNTLFDFIKQSYLLTAHWLQKEILSGDGLDPEAQRRLAFYTRQFIDAIAPTNFLFTNPEVLRATAATGGDNLVKGLHNLLQDLERGKGQLQISMTDQNAFNIGENIAATPGKVVFENALMQLIQYEPLTQTVHTVPLLIIPPWINKYYILDMREKNSFVRYCLQQGHTVFMISWTNPDAALANKDFNAYMQEGPIAALHEIGRRLGVREVNVLGYCLGGTLLTCLLAYLQARPDRAVALPRVASATFLVTMIDFSEPGELGIFVAEDHLQYLEQQMAEKGYLEGRIMAQTFSMLRANDLIWSFVVNNYLLGREPFPFDLLYWNADATNMPAAMHSFYLRKMYQENKLVEPGGIVLDGTPLDVRQITTPSFLLATREDHIAPWKSTYAATQLYAGSKTFVLSGSGHVAGVINPPANKKYGHWINQQLPADPEAWLNTAEQQAGSWWTTWIEWLLPYQGATIPAATVTEPTLEDAPGRYVRVRAA